MSEKKLGAAVVAVSEGVKLPDGRYVCELSDDAAFVDYSGNTSRVMHSGIKYSQKEASQPASTIIKGATLDDVACPTANVYYSTILKDWVTKSMYPQYATYGANQIQLMLPIQIKDVVNEYIFVFDLKYGYNYPERLNLP